MKLFSTLAAGAVAASALFAVAPASAAVQRTVVHERTVVRHDGPRAHGRRVCTTRVYHHRRVRSCRTVYR